MEDRLARPPAQHAKASSPQGEQNRVNREVEARIQAHAAVQDDGKGEGGYGEERCGAEL
jgi:hypothetical protein